ncbi:MAG: menaquinone biosynthesis decarboxylase [Syntrophobacterales bacterium]|nr:menaquinone biosynthesis decarboxylase [Syntrophobacterales bacterium]
MWYQDLQSFVTALERAGELLRIKAPVSRELEITEITDLASKAPGGGKALLFEKVEGFQFPVLTNAFGSERRMCMALGVRDIEDLVSRLRNFMELGAGKGSKSIFRMLKLGMETLSFFPRRYRGKNPPCQEIVHIGKEVDLSKIPVLKCWPKDGGPFITLPVVITKSLKTQQRNAGMYRLQVYDRNTTGMHWHIHKDGSHYFQEYREAGKKMPVAVSIGTDPATIYAATAPLPRGVDEILFSGFIRRKPVLMTKCLTVDLEVPAYSEFVLEGYVPPNEFRKEGPFGDHTGYYSLEDMYPVFHVTAITHRRNPIYPATIVGRPPMEDCYMAKATERIFLPLLQIILPEIVDYWLPWEGVFHNITVVAIKKEYPRHAYKVMNALWGQGQMAFCKAIVVVNHNVDIKNPVNVLRHILNHTDFDRDLLFSEGILDVLDHSAPNPFYGSKLGIDATLPGVFEPAKDLPITKEVLVPRDEKIRLILRSISPSLNNHFVPDLGTRHRPILIEYSENDGFRPWQIAPILLEHPELKSFSIFVLCDRNVNLRDGSMVLWKIFNNVDPKRDIIIQRGRIVVNATKKDQRDGHTRPWPEDIVMDEEVRQRVRNRAKELGIEEFL